MKPIRNIQIIVAILLAIAPVTLCRGKDASVMAFSELQTAANTLVEQGQLVEAIPLLTELIRRLEASDDGDLKTEFPIFLLGTGYIQKYIATGDKGLLQETLRYYDELERDYPESTKLKDALFKKVDVLRVMGRFDESIQLMKDLISGASGQRLGYSEQLKLLKDLSRTLYFQDRLEEGLPYFEQLIEVARDREDQALGAAASFEAYIAKKEFDEALRTLPILARESDIRYYPRINVALLKASDAFTQANRINDAALLLNLIKTTDIMIEYFEQQRSQKQAEIEQKEAFQASETVIGEVKNELKSIETKLEKLRELPTLRNELLVRRARNYTRTQRSYEAFWMFYDLMQENPDDAQAEFYTYASFSNALQLNKTETALKIGRDYKTKFPGGDYIIDVSIAEIALLRKAERYDEFLQRIEEFLATYYLNVAAQQLYAEWAGFLIERERYDEVIRQSEIWMNLYPNARYIDGLHYWSGMARLQLGDYAKTITAMDVVLTRHANGPYAEDALLRKGIALFYNQQYAQSGTVLKKYIKQYPNGVAGDQTHYFLGEIEKASGNLNEAEHHLKKAIELTGNQELLDSAVFSVGEIYEAKQEFDTMRAHFEDYIDEYGERGRLTDAVFQIGRAYEYTQQAVEMLALYRESIMTYIGAQGNQGVETLIENYAEKYEANEIRLRRTVELLDKIEVDLEYREKFVTDRGFLFEVFYKDATIDQALYNRLRNHPSFGPNLMEGLEPIREITSVYREQLAAFPKTTPENFFRSLLEEALKRSEVISEVRALMGLYRIGIELDSREPFDKDLLTRLTPLSLLYVADYSRDKKIDFAVSVWNDVLERYPSSDAAIVAYMRLADVSVDLGDRVKALEYLGKIVELFPGSPKAPGVILQQGELLTELGRAQEARQKYQYILRAAEWRGIIHARALYQIGESYMEEREYAKAHGFFERTFLGYSHFAEWCAKAYLKDAQALLGMGEPAGAASTLEEAVELLSDSAPPELMNQIVEKLRELKS